VVRVRQINNRALAVAVQAAIIMSQANRASRAVSQVLAGSGDRDAAYEEFRTYTTMLLATAPVLIDAKSSRDFLEQAQHLDGEMARALNVIARKPAREMPRPPGSTTRYERSSPHRPRCSRIWIRRCGRPFAETIPPDRVRFPFPWYEKSARLRHRETRRPVRLWVARSPSPGPLLVTLCHS
jgi:hypothetical protein